MKKIISLACLLCIVFFQNSWSQKFPSQAEIYQFNAGDEFQILHYYCCNENSFQVEQIKIIKKIQMHDTLEYQCIIHVFDFLNSSPPELIDTTTFNKTDTIRIINPDSSIFSEGDEINVDPNLYNGRKTVTHTYWVFDALCIEQYTEGLGIVKRAWKMPGSNLKTSDSLIYYAKQDEHWGTTLLGNIQSFVQDKLTIAPNPVSSTLSIKNSDPGIRIRNVELRDVNGKKIDKLQWGSSENAPLSKIDCQKLKPGLYFIYLSTNKGSVRYKFIKD